jgi:ankyrin repeat protein
LLSWTLCFQGHLTPLHYAALVGNDKAIKLLLDKGAKTDSRALLSSPVSREYFSGFNTQITKGWITTPDGAAVMLPETMFLNLLVS